MRSTEEKDKIKGELEYSALREEEIESLSALIKNMNDDGSGMFNLRSMAPEYYRWMYFQNPAGKAIVYCARHNGNIIGSFAMAPKKMQINGNEVLCGKTMDMFTNPDYQGLGLMSQLAARVFEESKKQKLKMWYVTPSKNSFPIFKMKWKYIESFEITYMMKFLDISALLASKVKSSIIKNFIGLPLKQVQNIFGLFNRKQHIYEVDQVHRFDSQTDELWDRVRQNFKISIVKDSVYMNWRFVDNPDNYIIFTFKKDKQIQGIMVLKHTIRRGLKVGEIVDYLCESGNDNLQNLMLRHSIRYFKKNDCAVCQAWVIDGSEMENEIRRSGIRYKRNKLKFLLSPEAPIEDFYKKDNWMVTQGDGNDV